MSRDRGPAQRASALLLMPVGVLVVLVLGAIAVDQAVVLHTQRELVVAAEAAAADAASQAVRGGALMDGTGTVFEPGRLESAVRAALAARGLRATIEVHVVSSPHGPRVEVALAASAPIVFTGSLPGRRSAPRVTARASAALRPGEGP